MEPRTAILDAFLAEKALLSTGIIVELTNLCRNGVILA